ncbi:hypothetical protein I8748_32980 [Nostoc sp. CENA67]|uniref:Uncharacterized protein n=1 Tax=Amazonocrinis nigriterrae CENA67 TaxID=2794033 RepID=A0A8J7HW04_9NOST|nr:hypothetical protein [Amazonocrinis nigriterrae]MBH8566906.1 hypothetical protein [Amazonocrinis nigriterrae CENA67]
MEITQSVQSIGGFMSDIEINDLYNIAQADEVYEDQSSEIENEIFDDNLEELLADISVDTITAYTTGSW